MSSAAACSPRALSGRGPMRNRSVQGHGAAQHVGCQVEVVCNAFGYDASFYDFDLGYSGEPDPRRLAPELKFLRRPPRAIASPIRSSEVSMPDRCTNTSISCRTGSPVQEQSVGANSLSSCKAQ